MLTSVRIVKYLTFHIDVTRDHQLSQLSVLFHETEHKENLKGRKINMKSKFHGYIPRIKNNPIIYQLIQIK